MMTSQVTKTTFLNRYGQNILKNTSVIVAVVVVAVNEVL